jgi:hypothetical protein
VGRLKTAFRSWGSSVLAGALFALILARMTEPQSGQRLGPMLVGALYGLAVLGILRLFPVRGGGMLLAGLLAGPAPLALLAPGTEKNPGEFASLLLVAMVFGVIIGALEWTRSRPIEPGGRGGEGPAA